MQRISSLPPLPLRIPRPLIALLAGIVLLLPGCISLVRGTTEDAPLPPALSPLGERVAGVYYYLWWRNPSYDPQIPEGNWRYATTTPLGGYYSTFKGEIERDVQAMKQAGFDFALVPLHSYDVAALETLLHYSEQTGFRFAPLFDLATGPRWHQRIPSPAAFVEPYPLTPESISQLRDYLELVSSHYYDSPHLLQLEPGRPTLFLEGARWLGNASHPDERAYVLSTIQKTQPASLLTLAIGNPAWMLQPQLLAPEHFQEAVRPDLLETFWNQAYAQLYHEAWTEILEPVRALPDVAVVLGASDQGVPGFPLDLVLDTHFAWEEYRPKDSALVSSTGSPGGKSMATLWPSYNASLLRPHDPILLPDTPRLLEAWNSHSELETRSLLLFQSWNNHLEGTALEPTKETGSELQNATRDFLTHWRSR